MGVKAIKRKKKKKRIYIYMKALKEFSEKKIFLNL